MPTFAIHNWTPVLWEGPSPRFITQHKAVQATAGTLDTQVSKLGYWGNPFTVRTTNYYASFALAMTAQRMILEPLVAQDPVRVWYAGIDYLNVYQTIYDVLAVEVQQPETIVRWIGNGIQLAPATRLVADIVLSARSA